MEINEILQSLSSLGSEQTRKTLLRHGAAEPLFGVKLGDMVKLRKKIKLDQAAADALWATGNYDARQLACMIADAKNLSEAHLLNWAASIKDSGTAESLANVASKSTAAKQLLDTWIVQPKLQRAGYALLARCANGIDPAKPAQSVFNETEALAYIKRIESDIHAAENWTRRTMMMALLSLGSINSTLRAAAEAAIRAIGKLSFDPGNTACEFPDPLPYLDKIWARR